MTKSELARFRDALKKKEGDLESGNRSREAVAIETSPDEMDRIQNGQERDLAMSALGRDSKLLHRVRAALGRIRTETFGVCLDCEAEISLKRLAAVPWTSLCIDCQEVSDRAAEQPWRAAEELTVGAD